MKMPNKTFLLLLGLLFLCGSAGAQSSANYALKIGGEIGGGGASSSTNFRATGNIPLGATGRSSSSSFVMNGGLLGGSSSFSAAYDGQWVDTVAAAARTLKVAHFGAADIPTGMFFYRFGGQNGFTGYAMTAGTGDTLIYNLPANLLTMRGLEYYFELTSNATTIGIGHPQAPLRFVVSLTEAQGQRPTALPDARYRIVGVPVNITGAITPEAVFLDDLGAVDKKQWRLGRYENGEIYEYPAVGNQLDVFGDRGFWMVARGGKRYDAAGLSMQPNSAVPIPGGARCFETAIDTGWNQVANPFPFNIDWADVRFKVNDILVEGANNHPDSVLDDFAYWYNGSAYQAVTIIPGWDGFFVHINRANVEILYPYSEELTLRKPVALSAAKTTPAWSLHFKVEANGCADDGNFAGVKSDALFGADSYDLHEPPPAPEAPSLAFTLPADDKGLRRVDLRPPFDDGAIWNLSLSSMGGRVLTIQGVTQVPETMEAWLVFGNGEKYRLSEGMTITLADEIKSGRLLIGTEKFLKDEGSILIPAEYALHQNFPNPFNPATTIKFALPEAGKANLEIINLLGQVVRRLVDRDLPAGYHQVIWDGTDNDGRDMATGIYFYRLRVNEFVQHRKMVLLK